MGFNYLAMAAAAPQPWEQGTGARGKHDPFRHPVPTP